MDDPEPGEVDAAGTRPVTRRLVPFVAAALILLLGIGAGWALRGPSGASEGGPVPATVEARLDACHKAVETAREFEDQTVDALESLQDKVLADDAGNIRRYEEAESRLKRTTSKIADTTRRFDDVADDC